MRSLFIILSILVFSSAFAQNECKKFIIENESKSKVVKQTNFFNVTLLDSSTTYFEGYLLNAIEKKLDFEVFLHKFDSSKSTFSHYYGKPKEYSVSPSNIYYFTHSNNRNLALAKSGFVLSLASLLTSTFILIDPTGMFYNTDGSYNIDKKTRWSGSFLAVSGASFSISMILASPKKYYLNNPKKGKPTWKIREENAF